MRNGPPSLTSGTTISADRIIIVIEGVRFYPNDFAEFERPPPFNETLSRYAEEHRKRRQEALRAKLELELLDELGRLEKPGRPLRPHFPAAARAPRPQARQHAPRRKVVPMEWDRAMRARWVR